MTITMKKQPRSSGKTTTLLMQAYADRINYKDAYQLFISHTANNSLYRMYNHNLLCNPANSYFDTNSLRGLVNKKLFVYIDEPFLLDDKKQACLLEDLESLANCNDIVVLGIGTTVESYTKKLFKDYICN